MLSKKYLSNKRTSHLTISISPALKEWINRYVNVMRAKHPDEDLYSSISAFYCNVMERVLKIFEKGKTLDDFDNMVDSEVKTLIDQFAFKAIIPIHEEFLKTYRFTRIDFTSLLYFFTAMLRFYTSNIDPYDYKALRIIFERMRTYWLSTKVLEDASLEFYTREDVKYPLAIFEFSCKYKNLHYENCKLNAIVFGLLGVEIVDFMYSEKDFYARFDLKLTESFFKREAREFKKELKVREKIVERNLIFLINYNRIIKDKDYYLWMKMAEDNDVCVTFINETARKRWIEQIEKDLLRFGTRDEFLVSVLKFFEKIHWIKVINEEELQFQIILSDTQNKSERDFLMKYLSDHAKITEVSGRYYLKRFD